jgi:hypothetical protein
VMSLRSGVNGRRDSVMWRSRRRVANAGGTAAGQVDDPHRARCESLANRIVAGLLLPRRRAFRDQDILLLAAAIRTVGRDDWGEPADPAAHWRRDCGVVPRRKDRIEGEPVALRPLEAGPSTSGRCDR